MNSGLTRTKRFQNQLLRRRRPQNNQVTQLLDESELRFVAECERMRVDRNSSVLSVLFIKLARESDSPQDVALLERVLEGRLRITDTMGRLGDGRIVILLPDTPAEGAWKVATDISEVYPPGRNRPECDVIVYPDRHNREKLLAAEGTSTTRTDHGGEEEDSFFARPIPRWKRAIDIVGSVTGLIVAAPIVGLAAVAVKISSPGKVFFTQEREGLGGRKFKIWKIRTMIDGADEMKSDLLHCNQQDGPAFKMALDPRTTFVGRLLRWTSVDELPQLWNVLQGDMSLVGPRPLPTGESRACADWQRRRLSVLPGMTCTWQVFGRGRVAFDDWVRMDLRYAENCSLLEDLKLMMFTLPSLVLHKGMR